MVVPTVLKVRAGFKPLMPQDNLERLTSHSGASLYWFLYLAGDGTGECHACKARALPTELHSRAPLVFYYH